MATDWTDRLTAADLAGRTEELVKAGYLDVDNAVFVHDLDRMESRVGALQEAFGPTALHAIAVKANPVVGVLERLVECGAGLECASLEEVKLSLAAGCAASNIVFDSPAKTRDELRFALQQGLHLNLDNFDELARVAEIVAEMPTSPPGHVGIRVNPQVGSGTISMTSVAGRVSKFGVPLEPRRQELLDAFARHPWLDGLHVHVGSQGCDLDQLVHAVADICRFRTQAEARRDEPISQIDIGGGLPARYRDGDEPPELETYVDRLRDEVPELFREGTRIVTEFGRSVHATCGWAVSRVEYVKEESGTKMAVMHLGADAFMRPIYAPEDWYHDLLVLDASGRPKQGAEAPLTVVGPLCFGGDILARDRPLPEVEEGDLIVVRDAGAYTLSMWSRHCSRGLPAVIGWRADGLCELKARESADDVVSFWS